MWSKDILSSKREHIIEIENELESELRKGEVLGQNTGQEEIRIKALRKKLDNCYEAENAYWRQRAKVKCIKDGDRNIKFFHKVAFGRRQRKWISSIIENGRIVNQPRDIANAFCDFFKTSIGTPLEQLLRSNWSELFMGENLDLSNMIIPFGNEEILAGLKDMGKNKAPGPNGLTAEFFITFWDIIGEDVRQGKRLPTELGKLDLPLIKNSSVLVNGEPGKWISHREGLRQGDSLSPYLFLLVVDVFVRMMNRTAQLNLIKGVKMNEELDVSHLEFADDFVVFTRGDENDLLNLKILLSGFELMTGLKANLGKTKAIHVKGNGTRSVEAADILGCKKDAPVSEGGDEGCGEGDVKRRR
ncbi:hypothetical protein Cni_G03064 [Canna indica]|uniref:Reverse transcriptase domain-containing protein n=1 Tax=Canna indica TaxID=4628 RepID=A0AAQ3JR01_9LILI|nr:hypothetical protein Cni_G03064 [Canna indica]